MSEISTPEISTPFNKLMEDRKLTTSAALHIVQQIAEQILLSKGLEKPSEHAVLLFFAVSIIQGSITDWSKILPLFDEYGGISKDYLRPFVKLALKLLPGPYEKTFLIKEVKSKVSSNDADAIVLSLKDATKQAVLFERCQVSFNKGLDFQNKQSYADAVAHYQSAIELCPRGLTHTRAILYGRRSTCFLRQQLWTNASIEAKNAIDVLNDIGDHFSNEHETLAATVEEVRARSLSVRIQALFKLGDLITATEDYITALSLNVPLDISPISPIVTEPSSLLQTMWLNSTMADILSIVKQESLRLASSSDDSSTFSPVDTRSTVQFLSRLEKSPGRELDWSRDGGSGFWFMSQVLINLLSLATIPQYRSYCPFRKAQLREILDVQPQRAFGVALRLKTKANVQQLAKSVVNIIEKAEDSLEQTAQYHLTNSTWGKNVAMIYQIAFQVAREGTTIKKLDYTALLKSIHVYGNGTIDYTRVRTMDTRSSMSSEDVQNCVRQLLKIQLSFPKIYMDALYSADVSTFKKLIDECEGRSVFELLLCSFALLHSQSFILEKDEKDEMNMFHTLLSLLGTRLSSTFLNPDISRLFNRLSSLPIDSAVDDEIASLVGAIVVLAFKEEAQGD